MWLLLTLLGASLPEPRVEEPIGIPTLDETPTSEPEEVVHSEELALVQRRRPLAPCRFTLPWTDKSRPPLNWWVNVPLGTQLDLTSMGSLHVAVYHYPVTGEVPYQYQFWVVAQMSLQLTPSKLSDWLDSPLQIKKLWANAILLNWPMSDFTTPKPLNEL